MTEMSEEQTCEQRSCWECAATARSCWSCGLGAAVTAWCTDTEETTPADLSALLVAAAR